MFTSSTLVPLLIAGAPLVQLGVAVFGIPNDSAVAYLTNCQTSDTGAMYSELSMYEDVAQSFAGQGPDQSETTSLGQVTTWEGATDTWFFAGFDPNAANTFTNTINANAQDPAVPTLSPVGCGRYQYNQPTLALAFNFQCFKDNPRVLYTTSDHECSTVYYCRATHEEACGFGAVTPTQQDVGRQEL